MALPSDIQIQRPFGLYVTHVEGDGHLLKISGQLDQQSSLMLESLFKSANDNLEKGVGAVTQGTIHVGAIYAAKYKDGTYYRAKIISTASITNGLVGVHFIDFGNKDTLSLSAIRSLDSYDPMFLQLRGQATDYYLARVISHAGNWDSGFIMKLQSLLCYTDCSATVDAQTQTLPLISLQFKGNDLSNHLISIRFGVAISIAKQEVLLLQMAENQHAPNWTAQLINEGPVYPDHVPFLLNQNFPANPASAMRLHQNAALPFNSGIPPPSVSHMLMANKASRTATNLKAPVRQPQHAPMARVPAMPPPATIPPTFVAHKAVSPKKTSTYMSTSLEVNSKHRVLVSYADEGPELFAVHLKAEAQKLQEMMDEINRRPHSSLTEPPMIGSVCLGRMSGDRIICRAIVMNLSGSQCKLFFVDFGDTEMVSYYDIFDIPEEFITPNLFALRFCLSKVRKLEKGPQLIEAFKKLTHDVDLILKVVPPEGPPLIQYGELYLDDKNILDLLLANTKGNLQFKWLEMLPMGTKHSVLVSYVDSCIKFYIQQSSYIDELNSVMDAVKVHCENSTSPGELPVGAACCARFPDDDNWYRACVRGVKGNKVVVAYVDYGNEQEVEVSDLRTITTELIELPAQAMKCALKGFESRPVETKTSNQLEMLALEKTLIAHVTGVLSGDTMLVSLVDDTTSPPLDIARKMNQLSQPRSSQEVKPSTPVRKDAPEGFSSPEGSASDDRKPFRREKSFKDDQRASYRAGSQDGSIPDDRRTNFRREKSFKDDRQPREGNDFGQRGGSFRSRDSKEGFDRSGPGRHSEKYGGKPDRGERSDRGGPKPWENNTSPQSAALPADDDWDESAPPQASSTPPRHHWDNTRDKRKPREQARPNWKKDSGVGKRLRQAAEAASVDTQAPRASVQDRLRRDRFNQQEDREERKTNHWGGRGGRDGRPEGRDNRERRDNANFSERPRRDFGNRESGSRDFGNRESGSRDFGNRESGSRDFGNRESGSRDFGNREFGSRDFGNKEYGNRDFGNREQGQRGGRGGRGGGRGRGGHSPRERSERSFDERSERSQRSDRSERPARSKPREIPSPVSPDTRFPDPEVETGSQIEVAVTWIISPESFFTQMLSLQQRFLDMMHSIPELYKGVRPYAGPVEAGASVLARYPVDGVLYRATVVAAQPFSKFVVQYVDFGNKQLVDARDIWQLDASLVELPRMALHCSLAGVAPPSGEWKADPAMDLCFNAPRYQCVVHDQADGVCKVSLYSNGASVADLLVEKEFAVKKDDQADVTLKDEPIDMTIIVGQQILCRVTHVESFEKFFVQLDVDKAKLVEETIANFDVAKLTAPSPDMIVEGTHCTIKHEGRICRAVLLDVADTANIRAVLPDYGNEITTSVDNVMILPTELSVYYYQSLHCSFNNYTAESKTLMSLEQLKTTLTGNKFIIYINDVDGIVLVSTLYDTKGAKVAVFEPDEGAYDEVVPLCTRAVFNYNFGLAYVSHVQSLNEIYLQKATDGDRLATLLDELYKFYEEGSPEPLSTFEAETVCAAHSGDGNWYRATVVTVDNDQVTVHFTDYGNTETLAKDELKILDHKFMEPCALALVAGLGLVALTDDALATLAAWTAEKEVQVTLSFGDDGWLASLHLDGRDLAHRLLEEQRAAPRPRPAPADHHPPDTREEDAAPDSGEEPAAAPPGCVHVYISHIDTPGLFWLQMSDTVDAIEAVQAELQRDAAAYPELAEREVGARCAARYLADELWYRAEILDADADITTVRFLDYGNTDVLDARPGLLRALPPRLAALEPYAVRSGVDAVPAAGEWSEAATELFARLAGDAGAAVAARVVLTDVLTYVDVFVAGESVTARLVAEGHARREERAPAGDLPECFASHVNSPSEFWIQLASAAAELQAMEAAMADADAFPALAARDEGVLCAARYPEDGAWYRAQVVVDGSEGTEVLFMDYGNASIADELRTLPPELGAKPPLSRKCALQKPRDIKAWSRPSELKFTELAAEGATVFNVQFVASGDISIVELYLDGRSVTEQLVGLCEERAPPPPRPHPLGQELRHDAKLCYVHAVDEFYVHLASSLADVDRVTEALAAADQMESAPELRVGSVCAAFWSEDEQWYRAKVLEFCDSGSHVQFIDYGNKAKCEEFRQLPLELAALEPLARCCRVAAAAALQPRLKDELDRLALDDVTFRLEYLDTTNEPTLVKIIVDEKDLITTLGSDAVTSEAVADASPDDAPVADASPNDAPVADASPNDAPVADASPNDAPVADAPPDDAPLDDAPLDDAPLDDAPLDDAPPDETPLAGATAAGDGTAEAPVVAPAETYQSNTATELEKPIQSEVIDNAISGEQSDKIDPDIKSTIESNAENEVTNEDTEKVDQDADDFDDAEDFDNEKVDLNESLDSAKTVIENISSEDKSDEEANVDSPSAAENDASSEMVESADVAKTPEREESKDSLTTDTGYTSNGDQDKSSDKDVESPKKEKASEPVSDVEKNDISEHDVDLVKDKELGDKQTQDIDSEKPDSEKPSQKDVKSEELNTKVESESDSANDDVKSKTTEAAEATKVE